MNTYIFQIIKKQLTDICYFKIHNIKQDFIILFEIKLENNLLHRNKIIYEIVTTYSNNMYSSRIDSEVNKQRGHIKIGSYFCTVVLKKYCCIPYV